MTDPDRMLALLADEKMPVLSPYFETRLHRKLAEQQQRPRYARAVRYGAAAFLVFAIVLLGSLDYFRWLIPLLLFLCLPEDWSDAVARRFSRQ